MIEYKLSPKALVMTSGSSKGTQEKYFEDGYWYKKNCTGYEGLSEELASNILKHSNITNFVKYERCTVNGKQGCRSKNFLQPNEMFLSFERLHLMQKGLRLNDVIRSYSSIEDRIFYTIDFIKQSTNFDPSSYLGNILAFDAFTLNQDRHFNNLGIIINQETEEVKECPIFDNGDCFLSNFIKFPPLDSVEECLEKCVAMPFSANAYAQAKILPFSLKLDYSAIEKMLQEIKPCRATEVVWHQMDVYRSIIPDISKNRQLSLQEQMDIVQKEAEAINFQKEPSMKSIFLER